MTITTHGPHLVVDVPPVVVWKNYIRIGDRSITATFDLTDIQPEYHEMALQLIQRGSIASITRWKYVAEGPPAVTPEAPAPIWRRFGRWLLKT